MARERMVTRTIKVTTAEVMRVNVKTMICEVVKLKAFGEYSNDNDLLKIIKENHETDTFKMVGIVSKDVSELLYGMPESVFVAYAEILPPRKNYNEE